MLFITLGVVTAYIVGGFIKTANNVDAIWARTGDYDSYRKAIIGSILRGPF